MSGKLENILKKLSENSSRNVLLGGLRGLEKESLRVDSKGRLSRKSHPKTLGSSLANKYITTDFSEALLEFITPPLSNTWEVLSVLCDIHQFTYSNLENELLWVSSMPCSISDEKDIPIAQYGSSNVGKMKTIYRNGLSSRYGRNMQAISGIHFNYSIPVSFWPIYQTLKEDRHHLDAFVSSEYLGLIRNFQRFSWMVLYLFGASPALCKSFVTHGQSNLKDFGHNTLFEPFGTSLRMSDLGYTSRTQSNINISLNDLNEYISDLSKAIDTPEPKYQKIGILNNGEYDQLSVNKLQIENEYYSPVRPKRVAKSGERPTLSLKRGGIEYVEIRSLDLNISDPIGTNQHAMRFMEAFLIFCLLQDSPPIDDICWEEIKNNHSKTAKYGRDPKFKLKKNGKNCYLSDWASEILEAVYVVAKFLDGNSGSSDYVTAVNMQKEIIQHPEMTPSARLLDDLYKSRTGFSQYTLNVSEKHKDYFSELISLEPKKLAMFAKEASESLMRQKNIEAMDTLSFEDYLKNYFQS